MKYSKIIFLSLLFFSSLAFAGGEGDWEGMGGELFTYRRNPWFVKNVQTVNYCVQIDASSFSATPDTVREVIKESIKYWKTEFTGSSRSGPGFANLATQDFVEVALCDQADLQFKMGYSTLTPKEVEFLKDPTHYIGVSVRKTYDEVNMKGTGFIYISSDKGPHAYPQNNENILPEAWRYKKLLNYALIHELGHVFGVPHTGSGIMSEVFLDQLLTKRFSGFYQANPIEKFLRPPEKFQVCSLNGFFHPGFFKVDFDTKCLLFEAVDSDKLHWNISYVKDGSTSAVFLGYLKATNMQMTEFALKPSVVIKLPEGQAVYSNQDRLYTNNFMMGPVFADRSTQGIYVNSAASQRPYKIFMDVKPDGMTVMANVDGKLINVLKYFRPSLLNKVLPVQMPE